MASFYHALFVPAFVNGLFLAILIKTGIDISPSGIGLMIFDSLQPYVNEQNVAIFRFAELVLLAFPWITYLVVVIRFRIIGLIAYGIMTIVSFLFVLHFWT